MSDKDKHAAEILADAGFGGLGPTSSIDDVALACTNLGDLLTAVGPMLREACMAAAVAVLRVQGVAGINDVDTAKRLVRAGLAEARGGTDDPDEWITYGKTPSGAVIVDHARIGRQLFWVVAYPPGDRGHPLQH